MKNITFAMKKFLSRILFKLSGREKKAKQALKLLLEQKDQDLAEKVKARGINLDNAVKVEVPKEFDPKLKQQPTEEEYNKWKRQQELN